jgi:hypothetical protein
VACTLSAANNNGDWSECAVGASSLGLVNKLGHTQFRLFFSLGDNDDLGADLVEFHDGSSFERTTWPQLVVTWQ